VYTFLRKKARDKRKKTTFC